MTGLRPAELTPDNLDVAAAAPGRGVGRFAVAAEARRRGQARLTVLRGRGDGGPEGSSRRLGPAPTGELCGEVVGVKDIPAG
jgi:diamine N-acetyltransferase